MKPAIDTLYEEFKISFPHVNREQFEKSIIKGGLIEASLKAMKTYADERLMAASNIVLKVTQESYEDGKLEICKKIRHKLIDDIKID